MAGQYLTAVFKLRPSRRKAAIMESARARAEEIFWNILAQKRPRADAIAAEAEKKARREQSRALEQEISRLVIRDATRAGLNEPIAQGLGRDIAMAIGSYIELRAGGQEAEYPARITTTEADHAAALDALALATTREEENASRDALGRVARKPGPRPLTIARARDGQIIRKGPNGALALVLNIMRATDEKARPTQLAPGMEAATGEIFKGGVSKTRIILPLECSLWHQNKFLSGKTILRSGLLLRRGDEWFYCAQFEMPERKAALSEARLGVDRGIVNPVALSVVAGDGRILRVSEPLGQEVGASIAAADRRRRAEQRRRGATSHRHVERVDQALHLLANRIVAEAKAYRAQVVVEKLDGLKRTITEARPKGARRGGWRRHLKKAQLGKLELLLGYKLKLAGLPAPRDVVAGGTSQICPACAARDAKNRPSQESFCCIACGFSAHADSVGAVNIARRGVAMIGITKGDKLAPREQDMVARLRQRDDGGLGPLAAHAAGGFVADRASTAKGVSSPQGELPGQEQKTTHGDQNARKGVFAARDTTFFRGQNGKKPLRGKGVTDDPPQ